VFRTAARASPNRQRRPRPGVFVIHQPTPERTHARNHRKVPSRRRAAHALRRRRLRRRSSSLLMMVLRALPTRSIVPGFIHRRRLRRTHDDRVEELARDPIRVRSASVRASRRRARRRRLRTRRTNTALETTLSHHESEFKRSLFVHIKTWLFALRAFFSFFLRGFVWIRRLDSSSSSSARDAESDGDDRGRSVLFRFTSPRARWIRRRRSCRGASVFRFFFLCARCLFKFSLWLGRFGWRRRCARARGGGTDWTDANRECVCSFVHAQVETGSRTVSGEVRMRRREGGRRRVHARTRNGGRDEGTPRVF